MLSAAFTVMVIAPPNTAVAETVCSPGQRVVDSRANAGVVVGARDGLCLVRYGDGRAQGWIAANELTPGAAAPAQPGNPAAADGVTVVRPENLHSIVYPVDALGHVVLTVKVNGAPIRLLFDTGATLVSLTTQDAAAAGLKRGELTFDATLYTADGALHAAFVHLREMRIEQLEIDNVPAVVVEGLKQSVLGMSFLSRLKSFAVHDGALTVTW